MRQRPGTLAQMVMGGLAAALVLSPVWWPFFLVYTLVLWPARLMPGHSLVLVLCWVLAMGASYVLVWRHPALWRRLARAAKALQSDAFDDLPA